MVNDITRNRNFFKNGVDLEGGTMNLVPKGRFELPRWFPITGFSARCVSRFHHFGTFIVAWFALSGELRLFLLGNKKDARISVKHICLHIKIGPCVRDKNRSTGLRRLLSVCLGRLPVIKLG